METKEIIYLIVFFIALVWIGKPQISFSPFSFKLLEWQNMLGFIFLGLALVMFRIDSYNEGKIDGELKAYDYINEIIKNKLK